MTNKEKKGVKEKSKRERTTEGYKERDGGREKERERERKRKW